MKNLLVILGALGLILLARPGYAQNGCTRIIQNGTVSYGSPVVWIAPCTIQQAGGSAGSPLSGGLPMITDLGVMGPFGILDAPTTGPYHQALMSWIGNAFNMSLNSQGGAGTPTFSCEINGVPENCFTSSSGGYHLQTSSPPSTLVSWLNSPIVSGQNPYGYLGTFGQSVLATIYGQPAYVGASRTSDTAFPNVCCSMGVAAVSLNDNTTHVQTAWSFYDTGSRLAGAGSLNNESDKFNLGTLVTTNPYTGNVAGQVGNWAFQCGGEPVTLGLTGTHCNFGLKIGPNGDTFAGCCGIIFDSGLGTIQAIGMAINQRLLWDSDSGGTNRAYVTSLVDTNGDENAIIFTDFGALFYQGTTAYTSGNAGVNFQAANDPGVSVVNHIAIQGSATGAPPTLFVQGNDSNIPIELKPKITNPNNQGGIVEMAGGMVLQITTVSSLPVCSASTQYQMFAISDGNTNLTFRSTTFTGGGSSPGIVFCNGTAWELH